MFYDFIRCDSDARLNREGKKKTNINLPSF